MKNELVTVLDLGTTKVTCLAAIPDGDGLKVLGAAVFPCKGVKKGVVTDLDETSRSIDSAIRQVQNETGQEITSVVVTISGQHVEGTNAQGFKPIVPKTRHITHHDVMEVINHSRSLVLPPDREQIQALPREFRVDGQRDVQKPIGMSGGKLEVVTYIVTGQTSQVQNIEKAVQMTGKKVEQMVLGALASGIGVLTQEEMDLGAVVLDIGGGKSDLGIFVKGSLAYSATLPIGGQLVTSDLSKLLKTAPEEAERLKLVSGAALAKIVPERDSLEVMQIGQNIARPLQRKVFCEIIESRMRELAVMVAQHIEKSGLKATLPGCIVLTGGGANLLGIEKLFEDNIKHTKVRVAEPHLGAEWESQRGLAAAVGSARFAIQCYDELGPAAGNLPWRDRVKSLFSVLSGKS